MVSKFSLLLIKTSIPLAGFEGARGFSQPVVMPDQTALLPTSDRAADKPAEPVKTIDHNASPAPTAARSDVGSKAV